MNRARTGIARFLRWAADFTYTPPAPVIPTFTMPRPTTEYDRVWDKALSDYIVAIATKMREAATSWGTSATALLGVISIASILKGRETLEELAPTAASGVVVLVAGAMVAAFVCIFSAAMAAQGSPRTIVLTPNNFQNIQFSAAEASARWLRRSRRLALLAFVFALGATILVLAGPSAPTSKSLTLVVGGTDGRDLACGELSVKENRLWVGDRLAPEPAIAFQSVKDC